jgi:hypothetical protein
MENISNSTVARAFSEEEVKGTLETQKLNTMNTDIPLHTPTFEQEKSNKEQKVSFVNKGGSQKEEFVQTQYRL